MNKIDKDIKLLLDFIKVYCKKNHQNRQKNLVKNVLIDHYGENYLCDECNELAVYAAKRREKCPKDPKPACKNCDTKCYSSKYSQKIREVMKFSGIYLIKRGRLDYLYHYFK